MPCRRSILFRTGAKGFAVLVPRDAPPVFFLGKENGGCPSKRKAFTLAVSILKSYTRCAIGCGVHGFAIAPCDS